MKYEFLTNISLDEAVSKMTHALQAAGMQYRTEMIPTREACGRICAEAQYARRSSPHFLACAMDGIALDSRLLEGAGEGTPVTLTPREYTMVDTGDPLPGGCDCVIMIEETVFDEEQNVTLYAQAAPWSNVRQIGEDISMGDMIIPSFTKITPALIGALLAGGIFELQVVKKPVVALIPTGDEVVDPSSDLQPGDVPEYNSAIFSAMLQTWGAEPKVHPIVPDIPALLREAVSEAAACCDAVITIAGSSAGRDDYTSSVLKELGELLVHGIAIKPGKPAVLGVIGTKPFFGVPGYPVSGILVMEQVVKKILSILTREPEEPAEEVPVQLIRRVPSSLKYREFIRTHAAGIDGQIVAVPMPRGAGIVSGFAKADGMIEVAQDSEGFEAGTIVPMRLLRSAGSIRKGVCVIGSHDPLIDEIADILARSQEPVQVMSSHVGSMGAIQAVRAKSAHLGGIHLLDPVTGEYNISYLETYFRDIPAVLVRGVIRKQGLMVPAGNPQNIRSIAEIAGKRYVNRQKGAGTRILLDYLLAKEQMDPSDISGYTREEYTHTAVAAQVAAGTADCGMGIWSAAGIYGLDFVPLWDEHYDFLVSGSAIGQENVRRFLEILKTEEFRSRLERLGGYAFDHTGEIIWKSPC